MLILNEIDTIPFMYSQQKIIISCIHSLHSISHEIYMPDEGDDLLHLSSFGSISLFRQMN